MSSSESTVKDVPTVLEVMRAIEWLAPPHLALDGDVNGLLVGNRDDRVHRVMLALDPYPDTLHQAVTSGADMLITHHALLYRPLKRIDTSTARGKALATVLSHDLAVYNAHTNLDVAFGGINDVLALRLGLMDVEILDKTGSDGLRKLVVYVPPTHHEAILDAITTAGAGRIGHYSHCTFNTSGTGTFLPEEGTHPYIGTRGELTRVSEVRVETIVLESLLHSTIQAMLAAHPYEEVAYDVYRLELAGIPYGIGRVGNLPESTPLSNFAELVRDRLGMTHIRFGGSPSSMVRRVAVLGGAGGNWATKAREMGADVLVTSDVNHHTVAEAWQDGLAIIDATHAALELPVLQSLETHLKSVFGSRLEVTLADVDEDPFTWV